MAHLITARASAALPASGAYDDYTAAVNIPCQDTPEVELQITYTRGDTGGSAKMMLYTSLDGTTFGPRTVIDGGSLSSGTMNVYDAQFQFPAAAGPTAEARSFIVSVAGAIALRVIFAEVGNTATPGTLKCVACRVGL